MAEVPKENASEFIASQQENFTRPRILDCLHSYCLKCIKQHVGNVKVIKCPTCNQEMPLPEEGISAIKSNVFLKGIIDQLDTAVAKEESAKKPCSVCDSGLFTIGHCDGCENDICSKSDKLHKQLNIFEQHKIAYFDNNQEHTVQNEIIDDETKEYLEKIKLEMNVMDAQKHKLDNRVSSLTVTIDKIEQEGANTIKAIESFKQQFIDVIESYTYKLKQTVRDNIKVRLGNIKEVCNLTKLKADTYSQLKDQETILGHLDEKENYQKFLTKLFQLRREISFLPRLRMPNVQITTFVEGKNDENITLSSCHQIIGFLLPQNSRDERRFGFQLDKTIPNHMKNYALHCAHTAVDKHGMKPRNLDTYSDMSETISYMYEKRYKGMNWSVVVSQPQTFGCSLSNCGKLMEITIENDYFFLAENLN